MKNTNEVGAGKVVLSYGGGVDSTAMFILVMTDPRFADLKARLAEVVWCDVSGGTGAAEWPETFPFVTEVFKPFVEKFGIKFTTIYASKKLNGKSERTSSILEYYRDGNIVPSSRMGACSIEFKVKPISKYLAEKYAGEKVTVLIGYEANETHRFEGGKATNHNPDFVNRFPLVEAGLNRTDCEKLIEASPLKKSPVKSACWFCTKSCANDWRKLAVKHPALMAEAIAWEESVNAGRAARGKGTFNFRGGNSPDLKRTIAMKAYDPAPEVFEDTPKAVSMETMLAAAAAMA